MADMRNEFPSQTKNRERWIIDTVRENQTEVLSLLIALEDCNYTDAKRRLKRMQKHDRDALLLEGGILTEEQRRALI